MSAMNYKQMRLPFTDDVPSAPLHDENYEDIYTTDGLTSVKERIELEKRFASRLIPTTHFNRQLVSYQANKRKRLHRWIKYKEGFSARLVELLLDEFDIREGQHIFDPFAGTGTTLLVAQERNIHATGIELLPMGVLAWQGKSKYNKYDVNNLEYLLDWLRNNPPATSQNIFPHIPITETAFPTDTEQQIMWYQEQFSQITDNDALQVLLRMALMSVLEDISFTRKDGQYLRWDSRSEKAQERDAKRIARGKKPYKKFYKSAILSLHDALI